MAEPYISSALDMALSGQSPKILEIYRLGNGWEVWAQVEIALGFKARFALHTEAHQLNGITLLSEREKYTYEGTKKRCDFLIRLTDNTNGNASALFYELKCMAQNQDLSDFVREVGKDIDKVNKGSPLTELLDYGGEVSGWVVAITIHTGEPTNDEISEAMKKIATTKGIEWSDTYSRSITQDEAVRVWLWWRQF